MDYWVALTLHSFPLALVHRMQAVFKYLMEIELAELKDDARLFVWDTEGRGFIALVELYIMPGTQG
jgi:hypothetical protein